MDWSDILDSIGQKVKGNMDQQSDTLAANAADSVDRIKMAANPAIQGPPLAAVTPDEQAIGQQLAGAVGGTMTPVAGSFPMISKAVGEAADPIAQGFSQMASNPADMAGAKALVQQVADAGYNSYHPIAQKAQSVLNRAMTYARGAQ